MCKYIYVNTFIRLPKSGKTIQKYSYHHTYLEYIEYFLLIWDKIYVSLHHIH